MRDRLWALRDFLGACFLLWLLWAALVDACRLVVWLGTRAALTPFGW